jgi:hypothetical protein
MTEKLLTDEEARLELIRKLEKTGHRASVSMKAIEVTLETANPREREEFTTLLRFYIAGALCCKCHLPLGYQGELCLTDEGTMHKECTKPMTAIHRR